MLLMWKNQAIIIDHEVIQVSKFKIIGKINKVECFYGYKDESNAPERLRQRGRRHEEPGSQSGQKDEKCCAKSEHGTT